MHTRPLGRSGLSVPAFCLGTMTFGAQTSPADAFQQMDLAVANGITFFDTAELYAIPPQAETYGRTEEIIGAWCQERGRRHEVLIATKVVGPAPHLPWIRGGKATLDRASVIAACDDSLRRLHTDYIDLYQLHWPARPVNSFGRLDFDAARVDRAAGETIDMLLDVLGELVRAGKIRHAGLSNETPWGVMRFLQSAAADGARPRIVSVQNPYSLLNRSFEVGLSEVALQEDVGLLAYAPLAAGTLTGKYRHGTRPDGSRRAFDPRPSRYERPWEDKTVTAYLEIAARHGLDPVVMALAFVKMQPFVTSVILGATTLAQLEHALGAVSVVLSDEVVAEINAVHDLHPTPCP